MELELALALPNPDSIKKLNLSCDTARSKKKRSLFDNDGDDGRNNHLENPHGLNKPKRVLIGWPPVKCRKNDINNGANNGRNRFVKVKMEGVAIGRKVDLSVIGSYGALECTLRRLFPNPSCTKNYAVTYEDEEGDWMLVGDIPWETFIRSVKRLKILGNQSQ